MPKAILEFDLGEPSEQDAHLDAVNATKWKLVVEGMFDYFRSKIKYGDLDPTVSNALSEARTNLYALLEDYNLHVD